MKKSSKRIDYSRSFDKQLKKAPLPIKVIFRKRFELFLSNPFHPQLNNHLLTGNYKGYRSINITGDLRVIYEPLKNNVALFIAIGTHSALYE